MEKSATKGVIFDIQRFSIHDGPGIRTTVFLKGCPMNCVWCHNPESIKRESHLSFLPDKCIGCGYCFKACENGAHLMVEGKHVLDRDTCVVCGKCTEECYAEALEFVGREVTAGEVMEEVLKDMPFYETSGGGMTISGGEPMYQLDFTKALLELAKELELNTSIETNSFTKWENYEIIRDMVDLFLCDWKETDPEKHKELTGVPNDLVRENLKKLHDAGEKMLIRCPIIPGLNDRDDHFEGIAELVKEIPNIEGVEIMAYHRLGESKVERFGFDPKERPESEAPDTGTVDEWKSKLRDLGVNVI